MTAVLPSAVGTAVIDGVGFGFAACLMMLPQTPLPLLSIHVCSLVSASGNFVCSSRPDETSVGADSASPPPMMPRVPNTSNAAAIPRRIRYFSM